MVSKFFAYMPMNHLFHRRRRLIQNLALLLPAMTENTFAQALQGQVKRIGILGSTTASGFASQWDAFKLGLRELGWVEGRDLVYEFRFAENQHDRLPRLAAELVSSRIDLLVTHGIPGTRAAKSATSTIPILMASVADPVAAGLVASFGRPEGNVTGIAFLAQEMAAKRLQLLKEAIPALTRVAVLGNNRNAAFNKAMFDSMSVAASKLGLKLHLFDAQDSTEYASVFELMVTRRMEAVAVIEEATLIANAPVIASLARQKRLPSVGNIEFAQAGGLIGYGADREAIFKSAGVLADKLLRGTKPADLPIEQPTQFELIIHGKTASSLAWSIPPALRIRVNRIVE